MNAERQRTEFAACSLRTFDIGFAGAQVLHQNRHSPNTNDRRLEQDLLDLLAITGADMEQTRVAR
jgi:hypothetical protein